MRRVLCAAPNLIPSSRGAIYTPTSARPATVATWSTPAGSRSTCENSPGTTSRGFAIPSSTARVKRCRRGEIRSTMTTSRPCGLMYAAGDELFGGCKNRPPPHTPRNAGGGPTSEGKGRDSNPIRRPLRLQRWFPRYRSLYVVMVRFGLRYALSAAWVARARQCNASTHRNCCLRGGAIWHHLRLDFL